ncbi:MAG: tetrahydrofolate dehydrogenase/cyclohydrolase catalytic domain-containing protein, partial [Bryobacteraceae bacterium]
MAQILDGIRIRDQIQAELRPRIDRLAREARPPGLAVILAGNNPASEIYVRNKVRACETLGIRSEKFTPPESVATDELIALIEQLNRREEIDGILVQLPLPAQV